MPMLEIVKTLKAANEIVIFTGAGISADGGIPTFRDGATGLWNNVEGFTISLDGTEQVRIKTSTIRSALAGRNCNPIPFGRAQRTTLRTSGAGLSTMIQLPSPSRLRKARRFSRLYARMPLSPSRNPKSGRRRPRNRRQSRPRTSLSVVNPALGPRIAKRSSRQTISCSCNGVPGSSDSSPTQAAAGKGKPRI